MSATSLWVGLITFLCVLPLNADEAPAFRTDDSENEGLPWFVLVDGEYPPPGSAHYFAGELIQVDHLNRRFVLRADRTDRQNRSHFDLPVAAAMLPYGLISYMGSPAALTDIPLGTHLHGHFYVKDPNDKTESVTGWHNRVSIEADFSRCLRLEDDFSYHKRQGRVYHVDAVDSESWTLTATLMAEEKAVGEPQRFDLRRGTRIWRKGALVSLDAIESGQFVQFNLTWATLYGPGRISEIWLDEESRQLSTNLQRERHRDYIRERGLPGWVTKVDNHKRLVSISLFDGVDESLFKELSQVGEQQLPWPILESTAGPRPSATLAVARDTLMTYDPVNDRKGGQIVELKTVPVQPGSAGVEVTVECSLLLEGFRPKRIVRVFSSHWKVVALPKEEEFFGHE